MIKITAPLPFVTWCFCFLYAGVQTKSATYFLSPPGKCADSPPPFIHGVDQPWPSRFDWHYHTSLWCNKYDRLRHRNPYPTTAGLSCRLCYVLPYNCWSQLPTPSCTPLQLTPSCSPLHLLVSVANSLMCSPTTAGHSCRLSHVLFYNCLSHLPIPSCSTLHFSSPVPQSLTTGFRWVVHGGCNHLYLLGNRVQWRFSIFDHTLWKRSHKLPSVSWWLYSLNSFQVSAVQIFVKRFLSSRLVEVVEVVEVMMRMEILVGSYALMRM